MNSSNPLGISTGKVENLPLPPPPAKPCRKEFTFLHRDAEVGSPRWLEYGVHTGKK